MADYTLSSGDYMRPYRTQGTDGVSMQHGPESTAQVFLVGALLEMDTQVSTSNFRLRIALRSNSTVTSTGIVGVAAEAASSVTDATRIFWPVTPQIEYMARTRGGLIQSTNVGGVYGIFFDSTKNVHGVDLANAVSTSIRTVVTGLIDSAGDSGGYVRFKFATPNVSTTGSGGFAPMANPIRVG